MTKTKKRLIRFTEKTTIHGINNIIQARNSTIKIVWSVCFITSFVYCAITIKQNMESYFSYKTKSKIDTIKIETEKKYPFISICNMEVCGFKNYDYFKFLNKYKKKDHTRQSKYNGANIEAINEGMKKKNTKINFFTFGQDIFLKYSDQKELDEIFSKNKSSHNSIRTNPQLISCILDNKENCNDDFIQFRLGLYRDCYRFEFKKKWNDLKVEFYLGKKNECQSPFSSTTGQSLYIHAPSSTLKEGISNDILIEPGTHTLIGVDLMYLKKLPKPFSDCYDINNSYTNSSSLISQTINIIGTYEQDYCLELCYQHFLTDYCNCYDGTLSGFKPIKNIKKCLTLEDSFYSCEHLVYSVFYNGLNDNECLKSCPKECQFINYLPRSISKSKYPKSDYLDLINALLNNSKENNQTLFYESSRLTSINIYIDESSFTQITEYESYTRLRLVGDIGGALGLFLGISFISLAEIGDFLIITFSPLFFKAFLMIKEIRF